MRVCVAIWSLGQTAMLTALLPRDCCAAHPTGAHARSMSDEAAPRGPAPCPMGGHDGVASGESVAMHGEDTRETGSPVGRDCTLRAVCNGPLAALASLLSAQGIMPDAMTMATDAARREVPAARVEAPFSNTPDPESPPPRA